MKFSLFEVSYWHGTEWAVAFCVIETSSRESALLSICRLSYLKEWQFDFLYFEFLSAWLRDDSPATKRAPDALPVEQWLDEQGGVVELRRPAHESDITGNRR